MLVQYVNHIDRIKKKRYPLCGNGYRFLIVKNLKNTFCHPNLQRQLLPMNEKVLRMTCRLFLIICITGIFVQIRDHIKTTVCIDLRIFSEKGSISRQDRI